jgi:hypothetical protein
VEPRSVSREMSGVVHWQQRRQLTQVPEAVRRHELCSQNFLCMIRLPGQISAGWLLAKRQIQGKERHPADSPQSIRGHATPNVRCATREHRRLSVNVVRQQKRRCYRNSCTSASSTMPLTKLQVNFV